MATNWIELLMERDPSPSGFTDVAPDDSPLLDSKTLCSVLADNPGLRESLRVLPVEVGRDPLGDGLALITYQAVRLPHAVGKAAA